MLKKVIAFIDGENLTFRYEAMLAEGRKPQPDVIHVPSSFVWSPKLTLWSHFDLIRVHYFTSVVGDEDRVAQLQRQIGTTEFVCEGGGFRGNSKLIPRIHKKSAASRKTKVVDVELTMDVMRAALTMPIDGIYVLSGDGDYLPLFREVTRSNKQLYTGAFSSGLADGIRHVGEAFVDLDSLFFQPAQ
jgi:uncharacterized LabA/DUF88 family protein